MNPPPHSDPKFPLGKVGCMGIQNLTGENSTREFPLWKASTPIQIPPMRLKIPSP